MSISLIPWLVVVAMFLSAWVLFHAVRSRRWMEEIQGELNKLGEQSPEANGPATQAAGRVGDEPPGLECVVRLHDPLKVAMQESRLAKTVTGIAPNLLSREVYRQVREETSLLLKARNIEADVSVRVR